MRPPRTRRYTRDVSGQDRVCCTSGQDRVCCTSGTRRDVLEHGESGNVLQGGSRLLRVGDAKVLAQAGSLQQRKQSDERAARRAGAESGGRGREDGSRDVTGCRSAAQEHGAGARRRSMAQECGVGDRARKQGFEAGDSVGQALSYVAHSSHKGRSSTPHMSPFVSACPFLALSLLFLFSLRFSSR